MLSKDTKMMWLISTGVLALMLLFHFSFRNPALAESVLSRITQVYSNDNGNIVQVKKPFGQLTKEGLLSWDAEHYNNIKDHGYDMKVSGGTYIFAFFPLFSWIWKISMLPPAGIIVLNYLMYTAGLILLANSVIPKDDDRKLLKYLFAATLPSLICFFIPYTEAVFLLSGATALFGLTRKRYWLYALGMFFLAMSRPAIAIIGLGIILNEGLHFLSHRSIPASIRNLLYLLFPLILGTAVVGAYQMTYGADNILFFIEAQKTYGRELQFPKNIVDWSQEGYAMNMAVLFLVIPAALVVLVKSGLSKLAGTKQAAYEVYPVNHDFNATPYLVRLCLTILMGSFAFILLYQGGNFHGLFRYILCTPFFYYVLFHSFGTTKLMGNETRAYIFLLLTFVFLFWMNFIPYSSTWNFSDAGGILLVLYAGLFLYFSQLSRRAVFITTVLLGAMSIFFAVFLLDCFNSNAWLFT
jgi:hypothetical protein